jgi:hypothetical protein
MRLNNDSGANYDTQTGSVSGGAGAAANNSGATSFNHVAATPAASSPAGGMASFTIELPNYSSTNVRNHFVSDWGFVRADDSADLVRGYCAGQWRSTVAVNRITLLFAADNVLAGSRVTLYGMK